jgi:acetate CoA/acetoacetate CoA-transferase alpha subunit
VKSDGNEDGLGIGLLIEAGLVDRMTASHVGLNRGLVERVNAGSIELEMVPQGILAERVRAGGAGLGGVLSDVGIGTLIAEGKTSVNVEGADYLVEPAIRGDLALIRAARADRFGNLVYRNAARNFNPLMAMAADYVVVEAEEIVATGELDPNEVHTPGVFVDAVVPVDPAAEAVA